MEKWVKLDSLNIPDSKWSKFQKLKLPARFLFGYDLDAPRYSIGWVVGKKTGTHNVVIYPPGNPCAWRHRWFGNVEVKITDEVLAKLGCILLSE